MTDDGQLLNVHIEIRKSKLNGRILHISHKNSKVTL